MMLRKAGRSVLLAFGLLVGSTASAAPELPPLNTVPTDIRLPGKFIWFDMATPAAAEQQAFYAALFNWSFRAPGPSDDAYALILNRGTPIGGMFQHEPPGGEQDGALWVPLMSVSDVDTAANTVRAAGGRVEIAPANVTARGRHALFTDPGGALFGALASSSGDPDDIEIDIGGIIWVDLFTRDVDAMAQFYGRLADYSMSSRPIVEEVSRIILSAQQRPRAGIVSVDEEANRSAWVPYVRVENVEATLEKVVEGGGFTIVAPDERILDGNLAVFVDPHGGVTGIVRYEYSEETGQ
jgi:predicted enzyme related to lactoylglutathione lyase